MATKAARETRNSFTFRLTDDQLDALVMAKEKAERQSGFRPSDQSIGEAMMGHFCERYGVEFPRTPRKTRSRQSAAALRRRSAGTG